MEKALGWPEETFSKMLNRRGYVAGRGSGKPTNASSRKGEEFGKEKRQGVL